jgi:hypothetical protein
MARVAAKRSFAGDVQFSADRDHLLGYLDDVLAFSVRDAGIGSGRARFYCWVNAGAHLKSLAVEALEVAPVLWQPVFENSREVGSIDEPGAINGPSL